MLIKASQNFARVSPRKVSRLTKAIKNLSPEEAILRLKFAKNSTAELVLKVIKQAVANATGKKLAIQDLSFKTIEVVKGPTLKRWRATARGRGVKINKKTSHLKVILKDIKDAKEQDGTKS